jgi:hypothetical protein
MNCHNRLIVLGAKTTVRQFVASNWEQTLGARYGDWLQNSPGRYVCQFETEVRPLEQLTKLSRQWPTLTFLLDYEVELETFPLMPLDSKAPIVSRQPLTWRRLSAWSLSG